MTDELKPWPYTFYECSSCEFTSILSGDGRKSKDECPICSEDGSYRTLTTRKAVEGDKSEGGLRCLPESEKPNE